MTAIAPAPDEPLLLGDKELAGLGIDALRSILNVQTDWEAALRWARVGGLAQGVRLGYGGQSLRLASLKLDQAAYRACADRFPKISAQQRIDLLIAAAQGVIKLQTLHNQKLSSFDEIISDYYLSLSANLNCNRLYGDIDPRGKLDPGFCDPRVNIAAFAPAFFLHPIGSQNQAMWAQMESKEGFEDSFCAAFSQLETIRELIVRRSCEPGRSESAPATRAIRLLWKKNALPSGMALDLVYQARLPQERARSTFEWAGVPWPRAGENPQDPIAPLRRAIAFKAPKDEIESFFNAAGLAGWEASGALRHPALQNESLLSQAASALPPELFERLLDQLDEAGEDAWARWMRGSPPTVSLDSRSVRQADWITALCHAGQSTHSVERVVERIEGFTFSDTKASLRWLKERSLACKSAEGLAAAKELLTRALATQEALELRALSHKASAKARAAEPAPSAPARRLSL